jgi:aminomuconate-semialdehyde/2-hydroxymuconate-6-semialdehyde dehydrogenase
MGDSVHSALPRLANFINGEFVPAVSGKYFDCFEPATGKVYAAIPESDGIDVVNAVQAASRAFTEWSATSAKERARLLNRVADLLEARSEEFAVAESRDTGKPVWLAREVDLPRAIANFRYFAAKIVGQSEMAASSGAVLNYVLRQPVGVAGLITPWNLPLYLLTWKLAPCLAMGNVAVAKPSELAPMTAFMLASVLQEAGLPKGVANIVLGRGDTAGATLVQHPGVKLISFTGGTETGSKIQEAAAPKFKKISLELGGKNANVIFNDADLKKALPMAVRSNFLNSGQICLCGSRLLVQEDIYKEFLTEFKKLTSEIKVGDPALPDTFMGPLISKGHREKVANMVEQARREEGKVTVGGVILSLPGDLAGGYFYAPTIIEDLTTCSDLWQREIFGPVVTVMSFKHQHEAVKWANTSPYGLSASIWTRDVARAHKVAAQIQAGTVWVNTWSQRDPRVPFGGMKQSGVGREGGDFSLDFYSDIKTVSIGLGE